MSLVMMEALSGQLFPAVLIARIVALQVSEGNDHGMFFRVHGLYKRSLGRTAPAISVGNLKKGNEACL